MGLSRTAWRTIAMCLRLDVSRNAWAASLTGRLGRDDVAGCTHLPHHSFVRVVASRAHAMQAAVLRSRPTCS
eukprot:scaffold2215_cov353-Prasinococcus_capsulatus_cf.AAC.5